MSAADDVLEMKSLTAELADRLVGKGALLKERAGAVLKEINFEAKEPISENRALELMKGKARRVDAWEKENAKRRVERLRERDERERESAHLLWLECELGRLRASGEEFHGPQIDGLERVLRRARGGDGAMAVSATAEDHDQSREWGGRDAAE